MIVVVGAVAKLADPDAPLAAFRALGLPGSRLAVRVLALVELAVGGAAVVVGGRAAAAALAALYLAFTAVVGVLLHRHATLSCGCFGRLSAPVTRIHLAANVASLAVAVAAAIVRVPGLVVDHARLPAAGVPHGLLIVIGAGLAIVILGPLVETLQAAGPADQTAVPTFGPTRTGA